MFIKFLPPPAQYVRQYIQNILYAIEDALNVLSEQNFPAPLDGNTLVKSDSLSGAALENGSTPMGKLAWLEWPFALVTLAQAFTTTSTVDVNLGGYFAWDPAKFLGGTWYLEASMAIADASATATCTLTGTADIGSVTTTSTSLTRVRSGALTMPATAQNLWIKLKTSNASYAASLITARLIFVPS